MILGFANAPSVNLVINNDIALDPNFSTNINNEIANVNQRIDEINAVPSGAIFAIPTINILSGYLECDGAEISRSTYSDLFDIIGTNFGVGDGSTTFNIPDLRGEFIRGFDNGRGVDSGRVFASTQTDTLQNITGTLGMSYSAIRGEEGKTGVFIGSSNANGNTISAPSFPSGQPHGTLNFDASNSPGARTSSETRPRNITMKYVIKY